MTTQEYYNLTYSYQFDGQTLLKTLKAPAAVVENFGEGDAGAVKHIRERICEEVRAEFTRGGFTVTSDIRTFFSNPGELMVTPSEVIVDFQRGDLQKLSLWVRFDKAKK